MRNPARDRYVSNDTLFGIMLRAGYASSSRLAREAGLMYGTLAAYLAGNSAALSLRQRTRLAAALGGVWSVVHHEPGEPVETLPLTRRRSARLRSLARPEVGPSVTLHCSPLNRREQLLRRLARNVALVKR
jgi:hypothetical protein